VVLPRDQALEERIAELGLARYGHRPHVQRYYSENNYVCRLAFDGSLPDRVIKVGARNGAAVQQEAGALRRLLAAGLEVPEVEFTDAETPDFGHAFYVMPHLGEMDLGKACTEGLDWAEAACERTGEFMARLHALPLGILAGFHRHHYRDFDTEYPGSRWEYLCAVEREGHPREPLFATVRAIVDEDLADPGRVVVHESFIPGQVITDGRDTFAVTDWETVRRGRPLQDLSVFGAALGAWYGGDPRHLAALVCGYTHEAGLTPDDERRLRAWECFRLFWWAEFALRSDREDMAHALLTQAQTTARDL
jgi:aminoglycoside phosphotransferase (APT) family kinase protein